MSEGVRDCKKFGNHCIEPRSFTPIILIAVWTSLFIYDFKLTDMLPNQADMP